jgi:hypothetical protein
MKQAQLIYFRQMSCPVGQDTCFFASPEAQRLMYSVPGR